MSMMGVVREINELDLVIALPNQLSGFVSITEISSIITAKVEQVANAEDDDEDSKELDDLPNLKEYFTVGQTVLCQIISLVTAAEGDKKEKRRIDLSLNPAVMHAQFTPEDLPKGMTCAAVVTSQEDHGYILDFGVEGVSGFIKNKDAYGTLKSGQVIVCNISKRDASKRTVFVKMVTEAGTKSKDMAAISDSCSLEFEKLKAGSLVNATVVGIQELGLTMTVFGCFTGSIDYFHVDMHSPTPAEIDEHFKVKVKLRCRILYVDYTRKNIGLTLAPHLLSLEPFTFSDAKNTLQVGDIKEVKVLRVDATIGLLVQYTSAHLGYVHISKVEDAKIDKIGKRYKPDTLHQARVIGFNQCDGIVLLSLQPKVLSQQFVRLDDIDVGSTIKGKVVAVDSYGVIASVAEGIQGLCPTMHLSDITLSRPEKLFKVGALMNFKVLSKDVAERKLILSAKKSLVNSKYKPILSYTDAQPGDMASGVIVSVKDFGVIVTFYNQVRAIVPLAELRYLQFNLETSSLRLPRICLKSGSLLSAALYQLMPLNRK
jgi:rRNA biogenesis protein RRP5